jgi:hypothetical protein
MSKRNGRNQPPAIAPEQLAHDDDEMPLDETSALEIQLAQSRLNEAQLAVQLRQREMEAVLSKVRIKYEENGKFEMKGINFQKMVVVRTTKVKQEEQAPSTN